MQLFDVGLAGYQDVHLIQERVWGEVKQGMYPAGLVICRHYPVITLGRRAKKENVKMSAEELAAAGVDCFLAERGGDVTYHGPGQLTAYPICNLFFFRKDIHWYLRMLEEVVIATLSEFGISGQRRDGLTGVWVKENKIASIGVGVRHWVTWHGVSLIVKKDEVMKFSLIRPCGMDIQMTSMENILGRSIGIEEVKEKFIERFVKILEG